MFKKHVEKVSEFAIFYIYRFVSAILS
jgi:hypothetical protein